VYNRALDADEIAELLEPGNQPPTVDAGPNRTITLPAAVSLDGTVGDDGLPAPPALTATWSKTSGPGAMTFGDPAAAATTATFSAAGTYVLHLAAHDGELGAGDDVTVTVQSAAILGDFDGDGIVTSADVDLLYAMLDTTVPPADAMFDLTGDSQVTFDDAAELVEVVVATSMADTNLDLAVDVLDLGNLANAYGGSGTFSDGDTDGDGVVGVLDLGNLANDYGKSFP